MLTTRPGYPQKYRYTNHLVTSLHELLIGDALYIDLDDTILLSDHHKSDQLDLTEKGLAQVLDELRQRGIKTYALTARQFQSAEKTKMDLLALNLTFDEIIHAPHNEASGAKLAMKGVYLQEHLAKMDVKPKRIVVIDDLPEQLQSIETQMLKSDKHAAIPLVLYHYERPQKLGLNTSGFFPKNLSDYEYERSLGGGTQSTFLLRHKYNKDASKLVIKKGAHVNSLQMEILTNEMYRALGVNIPPLEVYRTIPPELAEILRLPSCHGVFQVTQYFERKETENTLNRIIEETKKHLVAHMLMANGDVAKVDQHVDDGTNVYMIDAGDNYIFKPLGGFKGYGEDELPEFDSLRSDVCSYVGISNVKWFQSVSIEELQSQGWDIFKSKLGKLEETVWSVSHLLDLSAKFRIDVIEKLILRLEKLSYRLNMGEILKSPVLDLSQRGQREVASPKKKKKEIVNTVMIHSAMMKELRTNQRYIKSQERYDEVYSDDKAVRSERLKATLSQSELHLKVVLGEDYKEDEIESNIRFMLEKYFASDALSELLKNRLIKQFSGWIKNEKVNGDKSIYFYHGCDAKISFVYEIYGILYQTLMAVPNHAVFRSLGRKFKPFQNITDFIAHYILRPSDMSCMPNDSEGYNECAISANVFLFGNNGTNLSNSIYYLLNNYTSRDVDLVSLLNIVLGPFLIPPELIKQLLCVYEQYASGREGALFQIAMPREDAKEFAYAAGSFGVLKADKNGSYNIVEVLDTLKENITDDLYVKTLQARVMMPPMKKHEVEVVYKNEMDVSTNKSYKEAIAKLTSAIARMIVSNVTPSSRDYLHEGLVLFRKLKDASGTNLLPELGCSLNSLAEAVITNNNTAVIRMITDHSEWKSAIIPYPSYTTYIGSVVNSRREDLPFLEFVLTYSDLQPQTISQCLGEDWWRTVKIDNIRFIANAMKKIDPSNRFEFARNSSDIIIKNIFNFFEIVHLLNPNEVVPFASLYKHVIKDCRDLSYILMKLESKDRLKFMLDFTQLIHTASDLGCLVKTLEDHEKKNIISEYKFLIRNNLDLICILAELNINDRLSFVKEYGFKIDNADELAGIIRYLSEEDQLLFARQWVYFIKNEAELFKIFSVLYGAAEKLVFVCENIKLIENIYQFYRYFYGMSSGQDKVKFAYEYMKLTKNSNVLVIILNEIPENDRLAITMQYNYLIDSRDILIGILQALKLDDRLSVLYQYKHLITTIADVARVLHNLPKDKSMNFLSEYKALIVSAYDFVNILYLFDKEFLFEFINEYKKFVTSYHFLIPILDALLDKNKLAFVNEHKHLINSFDVLHAITFRLKPNDSLILVNQYKTLITAINELASIIRFLPLNNRLEFSENYADMYPKNYSDAYCLIGKHLSDKDLFKLENQYIDSIQNISELIRILASLSINDKLSVVNKHKYLIKDFNHLISVVESISEQHRVGIVNEFIALIQNENELYNIIFLLSEKGDERLQCLSNYCQTHSVDGDNALKIARKYLSEDDLSLFKYKIDEQNIAPFKLNRMT